MTPPRRRRLEIEDINGISIVNFIDRKILDEQNIQVIGQQLFALVQEQGRWKLVVDFCDVEYLSSAAIGKLITLNKMLQHVGGRLILCQMPDEIYEVFEITKFDKYFKICKDEQSALQAMSGGSWQAGCPLVGCDGWTQPLPGDVPTCTQCGCRFTFGNGPTYGVITLPTYENESVQLNFTWRAQIEVIGRLDWYAFPALEKAWKTLPNPREAPLNLNQATELSPRAARALRDLVNADPADRFAVILRKGPIDPALLSPLTILEAGSDTWKWYQGKTKPIALKRREAI